MSDEGQSPNTGEVTALLVMAVIQRAYSDLAAAAWRKRLTNADIDRIERAAIQSIDHAAAVASTLHDYDAPRAIGEATTLLRQFFEVVGRNRVPQ